KAFGDEPGRQILHGPFNEFGRRAILAAIERPQCSLPPLTGAGAIRKQKRVNAKEAVLTDRGENLPRSSHARSTFDSGEPCIRLRKYERDIGSLQALQFGKLQPCAKGCFGIDRKILGHRTTSFDSRPCALRFRWSSCARLPSCHEACAPWRGRVRI